MQNLLYLHQLTAYIREQLLVTIFGFKSSCKHSPTCSEYTRIQLHKHGLLKGSILGFQRVVRCW